MAPLAAAPMDCDTPPRISDLGGMTLICGFSGGGWGCGGGMNDGEAGVEKLLHAFAE